MEVRYTAKAQKQIRKIGPARDAILTKIKQYADNPGSLANNVTALKGQEQFRLRVGDYRVLFLLSENGMITVMTITAIAHRRDAYEARH